MLLTEPIVSTLGLLSAFINTSMTYSMCALLIVLSATLLRSVSLEH
jgi:hypothetical protein